MTTKRTILLIDDDALARRCLVRTLACPEYTFLQAENGDQGLEILATTPVHLVICDQHMGDSLGSDVLETVRTRYPEVVRLMMTSDQSREALVRAINDGNVRRLLYKPWDDEQLKSLVRQVLGLPRLRPAAPKVVQRRPSSMMRIAAILGVGTGDTSEGRGGA
jgi:DNA-binding NtrC family response regulator